MPRAAPTAILITGASSGIGRAVALRLAAPNIRLLLLGRDHRRLAAVAAACTHRGAEASFRGADLSQPEAIRETAIWARKRSGRLDGLVNSAGAYIRGPLEKGHREQAEAMWRIHVMAPWGLAAAVLPVLKKSSNAAIVNISSTLGDRPVPGTAAYSMAKAALNRLTECMALEWGRYGVRANAVSLGIVDTPLHAALAPAARNAAFTAIARDLPAGRIGRPEDAASLVAWLLSSESRWMTGAVLPLDGGISLLGK